MFEKLCLPIKVKMNGPIMFFLGICLLKIRKYHKILEYALNYQRYILTK